MAVLSHNGVSLAYDDVPGNDPPVLLVHGTAAALWGRVPEALAPRRVIRYARRGFDGSTGPRPTSLHDHVADALALLDGLAVSSCVVWVEHRRRSRSISRSPRLIGSPDWC